MVSYSGKHRTLLQVNNIGNTDSINGVFVTNISKVTNGRASTEAEVNTRAIKSELYYNEDGKRRLFVDLWIEGIPPSESNGASFKYYFSSRQELKRTFGGWRTNDTDYYFSNLNYTYDAFQPPLNDNVRYNFNLPNYSVGNATGPIIIDLGYKVGYGSSISGTGRFYSGGVPNAPLFTVN